MLRAEHPGVLSPLCAPTMPALCAASPPPGLRHLSRCRFLKRESTRCTWRGNNTPAGQTRAHLHLLTHSNLTGLPCAAPGPGLRADTLRGPPATEQQGPTDPHFFALRGSQEVKDIASGQESDSKPSVSGGRGFIPREEQGRRVVQDLGRWWGGPLKDRTAPVPWRVGGRELLLCRDLNPCPQQCRKSRCPLTPLHHPPHSLSA